MQRGKFIFVVGGARSGKSRYAQQRAQELAVQREGGVLFVATAQASDEEMAARIRRHQQDRPAEWDTVEAPLDAANVLAESADRYAVILMDCLTLFLSNFLLTLQELPREQIEQRIEQEVEKLCNAARSCSADVLLVSNEVGMSLHPLTPLGRIFQDVAGRANQQVAAQADEVFLLVCGIPLQIKPQEPLP